jgi:phosphatidylglycerophosphate synthase
MIWVDWLTGRLSTGGRIVTAAAPAVALIVGILVSLIVYLFLFRTSGGFHDEEMDHRGIGGLTTARARHFFAWFMRPFWRSLVILKVPPDAITTLSVGLAVGGGVALAAGRFALGGWLYVSAGALDFLDGRVARETGRATKSGAALDSILDRYCESAVLIGLTWYYRHSWVLAVCLLALTGSLLVPYVRARGEALGAKMSDVGLFQRADRIAVLGLTVALSPIPEAILVPYDPAPPHRLAVVGLLFVAIGSHATAIQRLKYLIRALSPKPAGPEGASLVSSATTMAPRVLGIAVLLNAIDFLIVDHLVQANALSPVVATAIGCTVGFAIAAALSTLQSNPFVANADRGGRIARFVFVATSSVLLNAGGVAIVRLHPAIDYHLAWVLTRVVVFVTWNYPLYRDYLVQAAARRTIERSA